MLFYDDVVEILRLPLKMLKAVGKKLILAEGAGELSYDDFLHQCIVYAQKRFSSVRLTSQQWNEILPVMRYKNPSASDAVHLYAEFRDIHSLKVSSSRFDKRVPVMWLMKISDHIQNTVRNTLHAIKLAREICRQDVRREISRQGHTDDPPSAPEFTGEGVGRPRPAPVEVVEEKKEEKSEEVIELSENSSGEPTCGCGTGCLCGDSDVDCDHSDDCECGPQIREQRLLCPDHGHLLQVDHKMQSALLGLKALCLSHMRQPGNYVVAPSEMTKVLTLVYHNMNKCEAKKELRKKIPGKLSLKHLAIVESHIDGPYERAALIYAAGCKFNGDKKVIERDFRATFQSNLRVKEANEFVFKTTHGHINEILEEGDICPRTKFVILSASYFLGRWKNEFDKSSGPSRFAGTEGVQKNVRYMKRTFKPGQYSLISLDSSERVLAVPYKFRNPDSGKVERYAGCFYKCNHFGVGCLSEMNLNKVSRDLHEHGFFSRRKLIAEVPKFQIRTETDVRDVLKSLGVQQMFKSMRWGKCDGVYVHKFKQIATVGINERTTVATSATVAVGKTRGIGLPVPPLRFKCDSTFYFFVVHIETGAVISLAIVDKVEVEDGPSPKKRKREAM